MTRKLHTASVLGRTKRAQVLLRACAPARGIVGDSPGFAAADVGPDKLDPGVPELPAGGVKTVVVASKNARFTEACAIASLVDRLRLLAPAPSCTAHRCPLNTLSQRVCCAASSAGDVSGFSPWQKHRVHGGCNVRMSGDKRHPHASVGCTTLCIQTDARCCPPDQARQGACVRTLDVATRLPGAPCSSGFVGAGSPCGRLVCGWGGSTFVTWPAPQGWVHQTLKPRQVRASRELPCRAAS